MFDDDLYVAGYFTDAGDVEANGIARWDGDDWHALIDGSTPGVDPDGFTEHLHVFEDELIVGGFFDQAGEQAIAHLARWDGTSWSEFEALAGPQITSPVSAIHEFGGELIVAVAQGIFDDNRIARWTDTQWQALNRPDQAPFDVFYDTAIEHEGDLFLGHSFDVAAGVSSWNMSHWTRDTATISEVAVSDPTDRGNDVVLPVQVRVIGLEMRPDAGTMRVETNTGAYCQTDALTETGEHEVQFECDITLDEGVAAHLVAHYSGTALHTNSTSDPVPLMMFEPIFDDRFQGD